MDAKKLVQLVRTVVQEEIKKTVVPVVKATIKEQVQPLIKKTVRSTVKNVVNEVLNEKLMTILLEMRQQPVSANGVSNRKMSLQEQEEAGLERYRNQSRQPAPSKEELRDRLMESLGVNENSVASLIFDIDDEPTPEMPIMNEASSQFSGMYVDADDDGVDLSRLGL